MSNTRTKNAINNSIWGSAVSMFNLLMPFIIRTIIIYFLGSEYLGLSSLFSSILSVLNLAELGFSSAIVYSMYKPVAEGNTEQVCALLSLYRKVYLIIGFIIFSVGLCITPFIHVFIKGSYPSDINIYLLFLVYLINTSIGYLLFAYKQSILIAHQRNDIISRITLLVKGLMYLCQIIVLAVFKSYYMYAIVMPITTLATNIMIAIVAKKRFPQFVCRGSLTAEQIQPIKKQVAGLMISKVCGVTRNSLDSLFISTFIGLTACAIYGNYYYIMISVHGLLGVIGTSMRSGIGNSIACETQKKNYEDMNKFTFLYAWISGVCTCCFLCLFQPFIKLWVGESFLLPTSTMILFCIYFYCLTITDIRNVYIDATGIWWKNRMRPIIETIANFILNITLVIKFGIPGIIVATLISMIIINIGYGSKILFSEYFTNYNQMDYFRVQFKYLFVTILVSGITYIMCMFVPLGGIIGLLIKGIICLVISNVMLFVIYLHNPYRKYLKQYFNSLLSIIHRVHK